MLFRLPQVSAIGVLTYTSDDIIPWWEENAPEIDKAVAAAANADYIIACVGENSYCETPGNLNNLFLSESQLNLVKALAATGKPVVLVLNEGRPRIVNEIEPLVLLCSLRCGCAIF